MGENQKNKKNLYLVAVIAVVFIAFFVGYNTYSCLPQSAENKAIEEQQEIDTVQNQDQNEVLFIGCNGFF